MLLSLTLNLIIATISTRAAEKNTTEFPEEALNQSNISASFSNASGAGFVWADTDSPDCENNTCVRKCCNSWRVYSHLENDCVDPLPNEQLFEVVFKYKDGRTANATKPVLLLAGWPTHLTNCTMGPLPRHRTGNLLPNGSFYTAYENEVRDNLHYCLETYRKDGEAFKLTAFTCYTEYVETTSSLFRYYAHSICLIASSIALTIVILCHVLIPKLRDLQGKCLLSHVCSLLTGNITLVTATLGQSFSHWQCVAVGMIMHTAFIATYMWLTVMCFDIWRFVRMSVKGIPMQRLLGGEDNKLFMSYCAVAWGLTGLIAAVTCTLQFLPSDALPDYIIRPHIGVNRCFIIESDANLFVYFFLILGTLSLLNVVLVSNTAHYLCRAGLPLGCCCRPRKDAVAEASVFNTKDLDIFRQRFLIFATTIFIWTTEVLSFKIPPKEMWELTDLLNTLQGVIILLIFLREKKKRELVMVVLRSMICRARNAPQTLPPYEETSNIVVSSGITPDQLEGSGKEQSGKPRTHLKEDGTASSASRNDDNLLSMTPVENVVQEDNQRAVINTRLVNDGT